MDRILRILQDSPAIDRRYMAPREEFQGRVRRVNEVLQRHGHTVGLVFSDEHYAGDVPYLGGNTNISIEQVAGVIGPNGFHIVAGLEGGYVAEQLADRAGAIVHKVELLQLADEKYPIRAERLEDVIRAAAGKEVDHIALLTPRQVIPAALVEYLQTSYGRDAVVDAQELYFRVKYEKSEIEMRLIADACVIADAMLRAMLAVLRPGRLETEVAAWGAWVGRMLGSERDGFEIMVGANTANRTLIGPALNRPINAGDWVHLGVAPKRDGLTACIRRSVIALDSSRKINGEQKYWFDLVEEAYQVGERSYREVASQKLPARIQEQSLVDFFAQRSDEISRRIGRNIDLAAQKPYTGTHNSGYTECQEFFGAITLDSFDPLGDRIVTMLDVALRGIGDRWNDVVIPGFDFCVVENTLGKYGTRVETLTKVPIHAQDLLGG
ncbi:MAG TPA: M24 family metallopeptidase [Candidatus Sulfotelmatobacter sp.]|nr:M24 family metallopeptidase [Candidatus Sulfotelmatobacter sp.]